MKRVSILVSATAMAASALLLGQACSSDDSDQDVESLMGAGGTAPVGAAGSVATPAAGAGGGSSTGGTSAAPSGAAGAETVTPPLAPPAAGGSANAGVGAAGAAGAGGMAAGGSAAGAAGAPMGMGGSTGIPTPPAETACPATPSPSNGVMCFITCTDPCGVHNLGSRVCTCTNSAFACASCDVQADHPLFAPLDGPLPECALVDELQEDDESGCEENERCQSIGREDGSSGANRFCGCLAGEWDCDTKPASLGG